MVTSAMAMPMRIGAQFTCGPFQLSWWFAAQVRMMQKMRLAVRKSRSPVFNVRVSLIVVGVVRVWGRVGMGSVG